MKKHLLLGIVVAILMGNNVTADPFTQYATREGVKRVAQVVMSQAAVVFSAYKVGYGDGEAQGFVCGKKAGRAYDKHLREFVGLNWDVLYITKEHAPREWAAHKDVMKRYFEKLQRITDDLEPEFKKIRQQREDEKEIEKQMKEKFLGRIKRDEELSDTVKKMLSLAIERSSFDAQGQIDVNPVWRNFSTEEGLRTLVKEGSSRVRELVRWSPDISKENKEYVNKFLNHLDETVGKGIYNRQDLEKSFEAFEKFAQKEDYHPRVAAFLKLAREGLSVSAKVASATVSDEDLATYNQAIQDYKSALAQSKGDSLIGQAQAFERFLFKK